MVALGGVLFLMSEVPLYGVPDFKVAPPLQVAPSSRQTPRAL